MLYEEQFLSSNCRDQVQYWIFVPAAKPKGIIQLVHGFAGHVASASRIAVSENGLDR